MSNREFKATEVTTTKPVRLSYVYLTTPRKNDDGSDGKYGATLLIPKTDKATIKALNAAVEAAKAEGASKKGIKGAESFQSPLRDGDGERPRGGEYGPECKGMMVLNTTSNRQPKIYDRRVQPLIDPDEIYSGMWANVSINFSCFSVPGNKGISCYLNLVQKVRDDQPLGGAAPKAEDVFSAIDDDDDDDLGL